jgi:hypothetical protein
MKRDQADKASKRGAEAASAQVERVANSGLLSPTAPGKLVERWPTWFDVNGSIQTHTYAVRIRAWRRLDQNRMEIGGGNGRKFQVFQVKEKCGGCEHTLFIARSAELDTRCSLAAKDTFIAYQPALEDIVMP